MKTYKVTLNWYGEIHTFWVSKGSRIQAKNNAIFRLAKSLDQTFYHVRQYYLSKKDRWSVKEVRKG